MLKIYKTEEQIIEEREQLEEGVWASDDKPLDGRIPKNCRLF